MDTCAGLYRNLTTHDRVMFHATPVDRLAEVREYMDKYDVIGIDEGQFFPDVRPRTSAV